MKEVKGTEVEALVDTDKLTIIDCYATWCGPCKMLKPILEKLSAEEQYKDVQFFAVDLDQNQDFGDEEDVRSLPTLLWYKNGNEIHRTTGLMKEVALRDEIARQLAK